MTVLFVSLLACILVHGIVGAGFDFGAIAEWYKQHHSQGGSHGTGSHSSGGSGSGCDNTDDRDHVIRLLTDWHYHHESDAFQKFYSDVALIDMETVAGSLPNSRRATHYKSTHDEAYTNHDTTPDISHLEELVKADNMNSVCRMDILHLIERYEHISTKPTTPRETARPDTTHAPTTPMPSTHAPTPVPTHTPRPTQTSRPTQTPKPTPAPTTPAPIVTTPKPVAVSKNTCDQLTLVSDLANTNLITHPLAGFCADASRSQSEALVLQACSAPAPVQWRQGGQVLGNCANIPKFSPISTFLLGNYVMDGSSLSGILLDCLPNGFKMATQLCGHTPQIYDILGGSADSRQDAGSYYLVTW
ncbi:uncharacterized protein LOC110451990 [Mizuhopecten yessoensis]|uniref:Ricin B lectin domain-containing protein n=1 Tax=Mizuhopecten yessoensis TaxID=6573 RepID=A0A210QKK7_MIZYE|nr:uncharacterized protein LOC110451990 [Mizuhopecten yessoensis]OWF49294.1 hypothetical protein KP79_PYT23357 [Mizuhopecten yessoensis]